MLFIFINLGFLSLDATLGQALHGLCGLLLLLEVKVVEIGNCYVILGTLLGFMLLLVELPGFGAFLPNVSQRLPVFVEVIIVFIADIAWLRD